ncbi:MAG TPA: hypothetical protein VFV75_08955 [Candidatus Polarisedimenticolaceae bacterium]|nr:hypothetical protein [Candidatus Polarisedimenticolaceae bacterium]
MRRHSLGFLAAATCFSLLGCHDEVVDSNHPRILAQEIPYTALPTDLDETRTYLYIHGEAQDPEGLLRWLWSRGVHPRRAWQPLQNPEDICLLSLPNPSFTVELDTPHARMADYHFWASTRGLKCASHWMSYQVLE